MGCEANHDLYPWRPDIKFLGAWNESGECFSDLLWMDGPSRMMILCPVDTSTQCGCVVYVANVNRSPRDPKFSLRVRDFARLEPPGSSWYLGDTGRTNAKYFFILKKPTYLPTQTDSFILKRNQCCLDLRDVPAELRPRLPGSEPRLGRLHRRSRH